MKQNCKICGDPIKGKRLVADSSGIWEGRRLVALPHWSDLTVTGYDHLRCVSEQRKFERKAQG